MTLSGSLHLEGGSALDMWKIGLLLAVDSTPIVELALYVHFFKLIRRSPLTGKATHRFKKKLNKRTKAMSHHMTMVVAIHDRQVTLKIFENGSVQLTGAKKETDLVDTLQLVCPLINALLSVPMVSGLHLSHYLDPEWSFYENQTEEDIMTYRVMTHENAVYALDRPERAYFTFQCAMGFSFDEESYILDKAFLKHLHCHVFARFSKANGLLTGLVLVDAKTGVQERVIAKEDFGEYYAYLSTQYGKQKLTRMFVFLKNVVLGVQMAYTTRFKMEPICHPTSISVVSKTKLCMVNTNATQRINAKMTYWRLNDTSCTFWDESMGAESSSCVETQKSLIITVEYGPNDSLTVLYFPHSTKWLFLGGTVSPTKMISRCQAIISTLSAP